MVDLCMDCEIDSNEFEEGGVGHSVNFVEILV